ERRDAGGIQLVERPDPDLRGPEPARLAEHLEVVRDGRLRQVEAVDDVAHADGPGLGGDQPQDLEPGRVGQRLERADEALRFGRREGADGPDGAAAGGTRSGGHGGAVYG